MTRHGIHIPADRLAEFCRQNQITKLSMFGSTRCDDFGPESDVDVLVVFEPGKTPGLFGTAKMEMEFSDLIGRKADRRSAQDLTKYFREEALSTAELVHVAA